MHGMESTLEQARRMTDRAANLLTAERQALLRTGLGMALCVRARVGPGWTPFAAAFFALSLCRGKNLPALLIGCAVGAFVTGFDAAAFFGPATCALGLLMWLVWDALAGRFLRIRWDRPSRAALTAGVSALLPALAAAGETPPLWLGALTVSVGTALLTLFALTAASRRAVRGLLPAAFCAGTLCLHGLGLSPAPLTVFAAILFAAAGRGAMLGAVLGGVAALCSGDVAALALPCAMGAAADFAEAVRPGGVVRAAAAAAVFLPIRLWLGASAPLTALIACAAQSVLPEKRVSEWMKPFMPMAKRDETVAAALRRRSERELRALSEAFLGLSQTCGSGDPAFGEQQLLRRMRVALCTGCQAYDACWPGSNSRAVKLFCQLMTASIEQGGAPFEDGEVPPEILRLCRRGMTVPARLSALLNEFAAQRHRRIHLMEARRLLAADFQQAAVLLNAVATEQSRPFAAREGIAARVQEALTEVGFPVRDALALRTERLELTVELRSRWSEGELARAEEVMAGVLNRPFAAETWDGTTAVFVPRCALRAVPAYSVLSADPDEASGDSCLIRPLDANRLLVALSDGMGSGEAAAEESGQVLYLLHALLRAGVSRELAVSTVNGVLLSRGGEELFATVDLLLLDLAEGRAEFTKLSACRSYLVRGGEAIPVEGGKLPLGILDEVCPGFTAHRIRRGDVIFMMTDGVADVLPEPVLENLMTNAVEAAPEAMAQVLVNAAAGRSAGRRDDMTVICVRIE